MRRRPRTRAAVLTTAVLLGATPVVAQALAPQLTCGVRQTGRWETLPLPAFQPVNGIAASEDDTVAAYAVDEQRPQDVAVTNGTSVQVSSSNGCTWTKGYALTAAPTGSQPFAGAGARIVSVALLGGRVLSAVQEGSGAASRPHVVVTTANGASTASDSGLPPQGAPRLLRAAGDGRTAYLTVSPTATGGSDTAGTSGLLPGLPAPAVPAGTPTGFLYRTVDGGASWQLQTATTDLPGGGTGLTQLDLDPASSDRLYGLTSTGVVVSRDGGATFTAGPAGAFTALTAMAPGQLVAFSGSRGYLSSDAGRSFTTFPAPAGVTSAAFRPDTGSLVVESSGALRTLDVQGATTPVPASAPARRGSLLGDRGEQSSVHALAGHSLLRYVDPLPTGTAFPALAAGDTSVAPPLPGTISPAVRSVRLPVGTSAVEDFALDLPKNPTPLDLFFLVDVSSGMQPAIDDVKRNLNRIVASLKARKVNLKVGVGILGSGPAKGETDFPDAYVYPPVVDSSTRPPRTYQDPRQGHYRKPVLYRRVRAVGETDQALTAAIDSLTLETIPSGGPAGVAPQSHEGQLIALKNLAAGMGTRTQAEARANLPTRSAVPPGQEAGFRSAPGVRHIVLLATNEAFDDPFGTDDYPDSDPVHGNPHLDFGPTLALLRDKGIQVLGLTAGGDLATHDLQVLARGTGALAPAGGVDCGGDPPQVVRPAQPLVCTNGAGFSTAILRLLDSLVDRQTVAVVPTNRTPVLGALDGHALLGLDVKRPHHAGFSVRVSCVDVPPGRYPQGIAAVLRQTVVGRARLDVTCVRAAALAPPQPVAVAGNPPPPPPQPVGNVVAPVAPAPPAAQPQVQPQTQVQTQVQVQAQLQPLTASALQEQQQLQLAVALNGAAGAQEQTGFSAGQQLAMVDRRKREQVQALGVLAFAMTACAGLGLARLRTRQQTQVHRAR